MGLATLGLNLTGDLLAWDQNSFWATSIRTAYLSHTPVIGPWLCKLAIGGLQFGTLTITRFLALHAGACTAVLLLLVLLHAHLASRHGLESSEWQQDGALIGRSRPGATRRPVLSCWWSLWDCRRSMVLPARRPVSNWAPRRTRSMIRARPGPNGRSADSTSFTKRWAAWPELISIFVIPGLTMLLFFAMPYIGRNLAGRLLNILLALLVLGGLGVLSWQSYAADARNEKYQAALKEGQQQAERVKELAESPQRIPVSGALTLLRTDAKTQGPRLFNQHCASCHDFSGQAAVAITRPEKPTASDLNGFASRQWLTEFMQVKGFTSPKFFGNTKFTPKNKSKMYEFIKETFTDYEAKEKQQIIESLSHEAGLRSPGDADTGEKANIAAGRKLITENCSGCHAFHGKRGDDGKGPELTGYGSRDWLIGFIGNPAHKRFYDKDNDRMPAFAESTTDVKKNVLSPQDLELLVDWLRGEWYEPQKL